MEVPHDLQAGTPARMSLPARLLGVITNPVAVYDDVAGTPRTPSNWVAPWVLLIIATAVLTQLLIQNADFAEQLMTVMREQVDLLVNDGAVQREEADRQLALLQPGMPLFTVLSIAGPAALGAGRDLRAVAPLLADRQVRHAGGRALYESGGGRRPRLRDQRDRAVRVDRTHPRDRHDHGHPDGRRALPVRCDRTSLLYALLLKANPFSLWLVIVTSIGLATAVRARHSKGGCADPVIVDPVDHRDVDHVTGAHAQAMRPALRRAACGCAGGPTSDMRTWH